MTVFSNLKLSHDALTDVAQWVEDRPTNLKVASLIPSQGTCLGCGPPVGAVQEAFAR